MSHTTITKVRNLINYVRTLAEYHVDDEKEFNLTNLELNSNSDGHMLVMVGKYGSQHQLHDRTTLKDVRNILDGMVIAFNAVVQWDLQELFKEKAETIKDTRKDWKITTWADSFGTWHAKISSEIGWGNSGIRNIDNHISAIRERARRAIRKEIEQRQSHPVGPVSLEVIANDVAANNVMYSITYAER